MSNSPLSEPLERLEDCRQIAAFLAQALKPCGARELSFDWEGQSGLALILEGLSKTLWTANLKVMSVRDCLDEGKRHGD